VVLANAAARRCLAAEADAVGLVESPLYCWLAAESVAALEIALASVSDAPKSHVLGWRFAEGEISVMTDIQPLPSTSGQRLIMLTFAHSQTSADRRLLALTEHARDIITVAGADGKLQYVSGGVRNSLGYTSEERESTSLFDHVHPDDYEALRAQYQQLVDGEIKAYSREFRVRHKDGSYRWLESSYSSALDNPIGEQPVKTLGAIGFGEQFVQGVEPLRFAGFHRAEHRFQHLGDGLKIEAGIADIGWSTLREQLYQQEIHFIAIEISALLFAQMMREKLLQHLFIYRPGSL